MSFRPLLISLNFDEVVNLLGIDIDCLRGTRTKRTMDKTDRTERTMFQDKTDHVSGQNGQNGPRLRTKRTTFKDKTYFCFRTNKNILEDPRCFTKV